ncbi:MAG: NUDIX domain-containing protein [Mariprofundaceae bacterium]
MKQQVISLIAIFNNNKEVLLLKRDDDVHQGGLWSFPGGKVEKDEMPLDAAIRELKEETNLSGKLWRHLGKSSHTYENITLNFLFFVCQCPDTSNLDCESTHVWAKLDQLHNFPMPEANTKLTPMLSIPEITDYLR